ncbi:RadC family protein [Methanohalobium evestigatum]|uniref:RadC family protein n=1 Tax=Methanohalobium evestigatum TaxID=2322 RepID=UPI000A46F3C7|nr:DNA repair protein RadC [Methanohalobium evestigatum]
MTLSSPSCFRESYRYRIKADVSTLSNIYGVGVSKAAQIASVFELARKLETFVDEQKPEIKSPKDVYSLMHPRVRGEKKEKFITLNLDTKNRIIKEDIISIGSLNSNIVHPREVFKSDLLESSAAVIITHNHPSGDTTPSKEDINLTDKLVEGGKLLGIDVLDHVIIGDSNYTSLKDEGLIE